MQEMTLDEYEKLMEEKNASLNKPAPKKADKADMKEFEGMTAYTRKVSTSPHPTPLCSAISSVAGGESVEKTGVAPPPSLYSALELSLDFVGLLRTLRTMRATTTWS